MTYPSAKYLEFLAKVLYLYIFPFTLENFDKIVFLV